MLPFRFRCGLAALAFITVTALAAPLPGFDFTGTWRGVLVVGTESLDVSAELGATSARRFAGTATVAAVPCTLRGKRKRRVVVRLRCDDGAKIRLSGILDLDHGAVAGAGHVVRGRRKSFGTFAVEKVVVVPVCGNGVIEAGESCDDGGTVPGDGCSATCTSETTIEVAEVEPNGVPATSTAVASLPAVATGSVSPLHDEDFFRIALAGSDLVLETSDGSGPGSCNASTDTILELRAADGVTVVGFDDDDGVERCSRLELHGLAPGVYFPCVRGFGTVVPAYRLTMFVP